MRRVLPVVAVAACLAVPTTILALGAPRAATIGSGAAAASAKAVRVSPPTTTTPPTTPPTTAPPTGHFSTLPPGSALPSDATCAGRVRKVAEIRTVNAVPNATKGVGANATYPRVTGNFTGTTDEILQWAACKWGIDEDIVRAQIAKESWWHQDAKGDYTTDQSACLPAVRTGSGTCPESLGLGQVRYLYHGTAFQNNNAYVSSAYNVDYTYAVWRACYEGQFTWLGNGYAKGDVWSCLGVWFSGQWRTSPALTYIAAVQDYLNTRIWETPNFKNG